MPFDACRLVVENEVQCYGIIGAMMVLDAGQHVNSCMKLHGQYGEYLVGE